MFDSSRVTEAVGVFFRLSGAPPNGCTLFEQVKGIGIQPSQLDGLDTNAIVELFGQSGIDLSELNSGQINQFIGRDTPPPLSSGQTGCPQA